MTMRLLRLAAGFVSLLLLLVFVAALGLFVLFGTSAGEAFVRDQATSALSRLFGPSYAVTLGAQRFEMQSGGLLALTWDDVALQRKDRPNQSSEIGRVSVAIRLLPLAGGRLEFGRLEIQKARIDLAAFGENPTERYRPVSPGRPASLQTASTQGDGPVRSRISRTADSAIRTLERQLQALQAFHFDTVAFVDITVEGFTGAFARVPDLHLDRAELHRTLDGSLSLYSKTVVGGVPVVIGGAADFDDETSRLESLSLRSGEIDLGAVLPPAPILETKDERAFGSDASISLEAGMHRQAETGAAVLSVAVHTGAGHVQLGLNRTELQPSRLRLEYREGEDRLQILSSPLRFRDVGFDLDGTIEPELVDGIADPDRLRFRVGSGRISSRVGLPNDRVDPIEASLWLDGLIDPRAQTVAITRLDLQTPRGRLFGDAIYRGRQPEDITALRLHAENLSATSVKAFWPFNISGKARNWVLSHIGDNGVVPAGTIAIDVERRRLGEAFRPDQAPSDTELRIDLALRDMDLSTVGTIPRLTGARGTLETRGGTTTVRVESSGVSEHPELMLGPATVVLGKPTSGNTRDLQIGLELAAKGPIRDALSVANADPIRALRDLDLDLRKASGASEVMARAAMRIGDGIPPERQIESWGVEVKLSDADPGQPIQNRKLSKLNGAVEVAPGQAKGALDGEIEGIPGRLDFNLPFGSNPVGEREIKVAASIAARKATELVPALSGVLGGTVKADLTQTREGLRGELDLREASLDLPMMAWKKGAGVAAALSFELVSEGGTTLRDLSLKGDGFAAEGMVALDKDGVREANLSNVALNPGDDLSVKIVRHRNGYGIELDGSQFDARPLIAELRGQIGKKRERERGGRTFDVSADIGRLNGFGDQTIRDFNLNYANADGQLAALNAGGVVGAGQVSADLSPRGEAQAIRLRSQDVGALLRFAGLYSHMESGSGALDLLGTGDLGYSGSMQLTNFTLVDEPRLSRIVGSSADPNGQSLSQAVGQNLQTERAFFDHASAKLAFSRAGLQVADGILRGPVFGSSFSGVLYDPRGQIDIAGSFMPAYGLNRVFGAIPVLGQILGNGNEGGLIGITYRLSGAFGSPSLVVNPISIIAPGIFRQIFSYQ